MTNEDYSQILERARGSLGSVAKDVRIAGEGPARFVTAELEDRGAEFYATDNSFIIDPAVGEELQGEHSFHTFEEALRFASDWLTHKL